MGGPALGPQSVGPPLRDRTEMKACAAAAPWAAYDAASTKRHSDSISQKSSFGTSQKGEAQTWPPTPASPCAVLNGRHLQPNLIDGREQGTHRR
jgi:hypothetical protein